MSWRESIFTLSVPELNNDYADISLEKLRCEATKTGATVRAEADRAGVEARRD